MFRQIAKSIPGDAEFLFRLHPAELSGLLEQAWAFRTSEHPGMAVGSPFRRSDIPAMPETFLKGFGTYAQNANGLASPGSATDPCPDGCVRWHHLIYAFCVEQTRLYDIFRAVLRAFRHGEELGVPLEGSEHWLRNTEELFFRDPPPFFIHALNSYVRPSLDASRRNAYWRMFGMDLSHPADETAQAAFVKPQAANVEFVNTFEAFLREVWVGIVNANNNIGIRPTDDAEIANHAEKLHNMLRTRRLSGNLAREEFWFVSMMSWFHLTLDRDTPIIRSLRAEGMSPEQRLFKVAERVNLPAHALSKSFFDLAEPISTLLILIETGVFNAPAGVRALYDGNLIPPGGTQAIEPLMRTIITHWSITTGRNLKQARGADMPQRQVVPA